MKDFDLSKDSAKTVTFSNLGKRKREDSASQEEKSHRRKKNIYDPRSDATFPISRSKLELFTRCPHCFYLDRRLGVSPPRSLPFTLNNAVDELLKKEFDTYREQEKSHPLMEEAGLNAIPFSHADLETWRNVRKGIKYLFPGTNFEITGAVDDVWINDKKELIIVDYKATSTNEKITVLNKFWHDAYKRQIELYQWLFKKNGFDVSDTAYFVYCNGKKSGNTFDARLHFDINLISHQGKHDWIEKKIQEAYACLRQDKAPEEATDCDLCNFRKGYTNAIEEQNNPLKEESAPRMTC